MTVRKNVSKFKWWPESSINEILDYFLRTDMTRNINIVTWLFFMHEWKRPCLMQPLPAVINLMTLIFGNTYIDRWKTLTYRVNMIRQPMSTKHQSDNEQNLRGFSVFPYCHISTIWMAKWGSCLSSLTNNANYLSMSDKNHGNGYDVLKKREDR